MRNDEHPGLADLAAAVARARVPGLVDLYLEQRAETCWHLEDGRVTSRETLLREGVAVRRDGSLHSSDGIERGALAALLGISARRVPQFSAPGFPSAPVADELVPLLPARCTSLRWRWSWAAVAARGEAVILGRPELAELTWDDGRRSLSVWPPRPAPGDTSPPDEPARLRPGRYRLLFAPAASAVLIHELFGHPLEADLLLAGASPWAGRQGASLIGLPLDVTDDPTRADLPGAFSSDDEGSPAQPRPLLRGGTLVGALADRESAAALGTVPGNARRAGVHAPPRPRVSNLVASVADARPEPPRGEAAVEIVSIASGTVEPASAAIHLEVRVAFSLRRGERQRPLRRFALVGSLPAVQRGLLAGSAATAASAEPGWCAKDGEVVATGAVAPWLLVDGLEVR